MTNGKVYLVGAGPGDPGLLTMKGQRLLACADVVLYDRLVDRKILAHAPDTAEMVDVGKVPGEMGRKQAHINALLIQHARQGKQVVRLQGGDPFVFGRGGEEAEDLHAAGVPFEVVPGVTSAVAALATARTELVRAQHNLEKTYIRLPYEGMVRAKETDIGQYVSPGVRLGVVFATDYAEVRLPLTQLDLAFVDLPDGRGDGPTVTLSAVKKGRSTEWAARIVRTEGVVDEKSRVTYVVASIADPYRQHTDGVPLPMGTFVSASISGSKADNIIRVPRAVLRGSNQLIFIDEKNTLRIRNVNIVRSDADYVYVDGGAAVGERVVATALESPVNGMLVRTTTEKID